MSSTPTELLSRLDYTEPVRFPKEALQEIIDRKDEMIPHLIAILESAHAAPQEYLDGPKIMLPTYSAFLLAQFRETRAYRPLLTLLNLGDNLPEEFFGDVISENIHNIVGCVFDGDEEPLRALIENPEAYEYARACGGLGAYAFLLKEGRIKKEELERYFHDLLDHKIERKHTHVWNQLGSLSADLGFSSLLPHIERAFEEGLCEEFFDCFEDIESRITSGGDPDWVNGCTPIDDVISIMEKWHCFRSVATRVRRKPAATNWHVQHTYGTPTTVGRNDSCPCGSGRKFKKCCGAA